MELARAASGPEPYHRGWTPTSKQLSDHDLPNDENAAYSRNLHPTQFLHEFVESLNISEERPL